jgi:uncharacterized membrane protein
MMLQRMPRLFKHLLVLPTVVSRYFPAASMQRIAAAIASNEIMHAGEICFVVESNLSIFDILRKKTAKQRAVEVFSQYQVWDTENNNGVLIYCLLAEHDFEILADRGIHQHIGAQGWESISHEMETYFKQGNFEAGVVFGVHQIGALIARHYPAQREEINELSNAPIII